MEIQQTRTVAKVMTSDVVVSKSYESGIQGATGKAIVKRSYDSGTGVSGLREMLKPKGIEVFSIKASEQFEISPAFGESSND